MRNVPLKAFAHNSPLKKKLSLSSTAPTENKEVSLNLKKKGSSTGSFNTSAIQDITEDVSKNVDFLQKKHTLYKNKGLTLKGQVKLPELSASWDPKNKSFSSFGSPQLGLTNKANVSGSYKLGKKATLSGGVNWETGQKPKYNVGLNINI